MMEDAAPAPTRVDEKARLIARRLEHLLGDWRPGELAALAQEMAVLELRFEGRCD